MSHKITGSVDVAKEVAKLYWQSGLEIKNCMPKNSGLVVAEVL